MRIILAKLVWGFEWELVKNVDWVEETRMYLLWKKPELKVRLGLLDRVAENVEWSFFAEHSFGVE